MTGSSSFWFANTGAASFYNDVVGQSLKIDDGSDARLTRTLGTATNRAKYTLSWWMKLSDTLNTGSSATIFDSGSSGSNYSFIYLSNGTKLACNGVSGGSNSYALTTNIQLRDPTAWYHCMFVYDSAQSTDTNRIYFIVNGTRLTGYTGSPIYPTQSSNDPHWNNSGAHYIGYGGGAVGVGDFDGYLADIYHIDGQALDADDFTETKEGALIPKEYSGSYGNNGFHLNFKKELAATNGYSHYFSSSDAIFSNASHYDIGSSDDFTLEFFHKSAMSDAPNSLGYYQTAGPHFMLQLNGTSYVYMYTGNGASRTFTAGGDASYTANAWNHTAIVRSSGTMKCYINGYQTTAGTTSYSDTTAWDTDRFIVGRAHGPSQPGFTGYVSNVRLVVGSAVYTSNFTPSTTPLTNITNTKLLICQTATITKDNSSNDVTGTTSGTITAYTDSPFTGGSPFYNDKSGTGNHFTHTNIIPNDVVIDSPENNFCTFAGNLNRTGQSLTFTEGNLEVASGSFWSSSVWNRMSMAVIGGSTGKYYAEFVNYGSSGGGSTVIGVGSYEALANNTTQHNDAITYYYTYIDQNGSRANIGGNYASAPGISGNEVVRLAWDVSNGKVWIGGSQEFFDVGSGVGNPANGTNPSGTISNYAGSPIGVLHNRSVNVGRCIMNFGQNGTFNGTLTAGGYADENGDGNFFYSVPSGFVCLSSKNLPEPAIGPNSDTQPTSHFIPYSYTADNTDNKARTGMGFQPDLLWIKCRDTAFSNGLYDSSRGADKYLSSNTTGVETTYDLMSSFDSDGFTTQNDSTVGNLWNYSSDKYIVWSWKANGGTTTTNDASATGVGSIDSVYQANTDAGFSIVTYTGTGSNGTLAHGLGVAPKLMFIKGLSAGGSGPHNWIAYHGANGSDPETDYLYLSTTASTDDSNTIFNDTAPTSTVFSLGTHVTVNENTVNYVAYIWAEIEGFSKFGSFTSIGNSNGEYVYLGFKPALFVAKSLGTENWIVLDNKRPGYNPTGNYLYWNLSNTEGGAGGEYVDLLSNGVKIRTTGASIGSGSQKYVYMAWAEMPQKYSLAR